MMDLEIIKELMSKLKDEMKYGKDDLAHRLGRHDELSEKPEVKITKVIGAMPEDEEDEDDILGSLGHRDDKSFDDEDEDEDEEDESPADSLKARLMKLRG